MRYLFIDRIRRIEHGRSIVATKNVALSEEYFRDHFVGNPVMPGALMIEALAQAGTALLEISSGHTRKALLVMVERAKFRALVRPGDVLTISGEIVSLDADFAQMDGTIDVEGARVADARIVFALKDAGEFYPIALRAVTASLYQTWLRGAEVVTPSAEVADE